MKNVLVCVMLAAAMLGCAPRQDPEIAKLRERIGWLEEDRTKTLALIEGLGNLNRLVAQVAETNAANTLRKDVALYNTLANAKAIQEEQARWLIRLQMQVNAIEGDARTNRQAIIRLGSRVASR